MPRFFLFLFSLFLTVSHAIAIPGQPPTARPSNKKMWLYFDLGDTIIDTKDMKNLHYFPGARQYLRQIHQMGLRAGLISNIPESWGMDYPQKLAALKKVIATGWAEPQPFEWEVFDDIILPMHDSERKPAPILFLAAIEVAQGCPSAYIGETPAEITAARNQGMAAKLFVGNDPELYIHPSRVREFLVKNYKRPFDPVCLLNRK